MRACIWGTSILVRNFLEQPERSPQAKSNFSWAGSIHPRGVAFYFSSVHRVYSDNHRYLPESTGLLVHTHAHSHSTPIAERAVISFSLDGCTQMSKVSVQERIVGIVCLPLSIFPSITSQESLTLPLSSATVFPNWLPPEVANRMIFLPEKS